jgi:hypothetical protein
MRLGILLVTLGAISLTAEAVWSWLETRHFLQQVQAGLAREFPSHTSWPFLFGIILLVSGGYLIYVSRFRQPRG